MTLELRWFFPGALPNAPRRWIDVVLPGPAVVPAARSDLYLVASGRDDVGLKLRERKLELKLRRRSAAFAGRNGSVSGVPELWEKWMWSYDRETDVDAGFARQARGLRLAVRKIRRRRKYEVRRGFALHPIDVEHEAERAVLVEVTDLVVLGRRFWTLGFDAIGPDRNVDTILARAVEKLLAAFPRTPRLSSGRSFGYPDWVMRRLGKP